MLLLTLSTIRNILMLDLQNIYKRIETDEKAY